MQTIHKSRPERVWAGQMPRAGRPESQQTLSAAMKYADSITELCEVAASCIFDELHAEHALVQISTANERYESSTGDADWAPLTQALSVRIPDAPKPVVRLLDEADGRRCAAIGLALPCTGPESGQIVVMIEAETLTAARVALQRLLALSRMLVLAMDSLNDRLQRQVGAGARLATLAKSVTYTSVDEFCYAIANGLRVEADADLVAVGLVYGSSVKLSCISGLDELDTSSPGSQLIRDSMEEASDAGRAICVQRPADSETQQHSDGHPLTSRWQRMAGDSAVASVPLLNHAGDCVAVVSLQGRRGRQMTARDLQSIFDLTTPLVASVDLMKAGRRNLPRHVLDTATRFAQAVCGPFRIPTVVAISVLALLGGWMALGVTDYVVRTPCTIVASRTRQLSVPWEATLSQVLVRPGDIVEDGQILAVLDTQLLEGERVRAESELKAARIAVIGAAREAIPAKIGQAVSRQELAVADLDRIDRQLATAQIRAPFRGQIISDDISARTGGTVPIGEPLFEIVPDGELAVELDLPESVLAYVAAGQPGQFSMNARPGTTEFCRLDRMDPQAAAGHNGNMVSGRAVIARQATWLRPGMQGTVKINTGERPVWWAWLHRAVDTVQYEMWAMTSTAEEPEE